MNSKWLHLVARLADTISARSLTEPEQEYVDGLLAGDAEQELFWGQSVADQRHGLASALHVEAHTTDRAGLLRAALLHDVGKQQAQLGVIGRSVAEGGAKLGIRVGGSFDLHLSHGEIGARLLRDAGAETLVVDFARFHHERRPSTIGPEDWQLLTEADRARLPGR